VKTRNLILIFFKYLFQLDQLTRRKQRPLFAFVRRDLWFAFTIRFRTESFLPNKNIENFKSMRQIIHTYIYIIIL